MSVDDLRAIADEAIRMLEKLDRENAFKESHPLCGFKVIRLRRWLTVVEQELGVRPVKTKDPS